MFRRHEENPRYEVSDRGVVRIQLSLLNHCYGDKKVMRVHLLGAFQDTVRFDPGNYGYPF